MARNGEKWSKPFRARMTNPAPAVDYIGEFSHRLDAHNRVTVPSAWRVPGDEGNYYFAWPHPEGHLAVYPPEMLAELKEKAQALKMSNPRANRLLRTVFGRGSKFGCDKQGRILLPQALLGHAGAEKDIVLVGVGRYFEVWSAERYEASTDEDFDMLSAMQELGF